MNGGLGNDGSPPKQLGAGPKSRICYICGRPYGTNSYEIHVKQCKELWIAREAQKDPKERKKLPEDPFANGGNGFNSPSKSGGGGGSNESGGHSHGDNNSSGGGAGGGGAMTLEEMNKIAGAAFNSEALDTCLHCGRTFLPEKLVIHNRSCTADNPARKLTDNVKRGAPEVKLFQDQAPKSAAPTPTKRPSSQAASRSRRPVESTEEDDEQEDNNGGTAEDSVNMRISNGNLVPVGHLGGPSGRGLRKPSQSPVPRQPRQQQNSSVSPGNVFNIADVSTAQPEEVYAFLATKLVNLEVTAECLMNEISDLKVFMESLQKSSSR